MRVVTQPLAIRDSGGGHPRPEIALVAIGAGGMGPVLLNDGMQSRDCCMQWGEHEFPDRRGKGEEARQKELYNIDHAFSHKLYGYRMEQHCVVLNGAKVANRRAVRRKIGGQSRGENCLPTEV